MKILVLASRNPVKARAARAGFERMFPREELRIDTLSVPSGVADQPATDAETRLGAENRARAAQSEHPEADFWVGIEGGIEDDGREMLAFAWIVVHSEGLTGRSRSASFPLPRQIAELVRQGAELGEADDQVFGQTNTKQGSGAVGLLTGGVIDRAALYAHAMVLALIPFRKDPTS